MIATNRTSREANRRLAEAREVSEGCARPSSFARHQIRGSKKMTEKITTSFTPSALASPSGGNVVVIIHPRESASPVVSRLDRKETSERYLSSQTRRRILYLQTRVGAE